MAKKLVLASLAILFFMTLLLGNQRQRRYSLPRGAERHGVHLCADLVFKRPRV